MIVRDEEEFLPRCLASVEGAVDEICVVDTGSSDRTVEIAREHGARVKEIAWPDSFAVARNASLEMATGEWILVLDADEVLERGAAEKLREMSHSSNLAGALLRFTHRLDGATADGASQEGWLLRFFRSGSEARFEGALHEQLGLGFEARALADGRHVLMSAVRVEHFGYLDDVRVRKDKSARNRRLFEQAVIDEPDNLFLAFKFADFLRGEGERGRAIDIFDELCDRLLDLPTDAAPYAYHAECFALLALELLESGQADEAGRRIEQAHGRFTPTVHFHFVRGCWLLRHARFEEALLEFERCRRLDGPVTVQVPAPGITTWKTTLGVSEALEGLGQRAEAEQILRDETLRSPDVAEVALAYVALLARAGHLRAAIGACMEALRRCPRSAALWILCGELMLRGNFSANALQAAEKAVSVAHPRESERARRLLERCAAAAP